MPSLINPPCTTDITPCPAPITSLGGIASTPPFFNENIPERDQGVLVINGRAGAPPLQEYIERAEWIQATTAAGSYAPYLRRSPLPGRPVRPFYLYLMRGDQQIANTGTAALIRFGDFADRVTMYRHDLFAQNALLPNLHLFIVQTFAEPPLADLALEAQDQVGEFFQTEGATLKDPDGAGVLFEVPASFIPNDLGFIQ